MLLFDAFALIHRAFHALPDFTAPDGTHVSAVYGFFSTFLKAVRDTKPDYVVVAFDLPAATNRHKVFEAYKATRPEAPPLLSEQIPLVKELVESMGMPIISSPGYEAEDVMATVIAKTKKEDLSYVIVTGDHDTLQLAKRNVKIYFLRRGLADVALIDDRGVEDLYGVTPKEMIEVKALTGDTTDNIPGIQGIGPKTAGELVKEYGSIEKIFDNLTKLPEKYRRLLEGQKEKALLAKNLVAIYDDAPLEVTLNSFRWSDDQLLKALPVLERYAMQTLIKRVKEPTAYKKLKATRPPVEQKTLL